MADNVETGERRPQTSEEIFNFIVDNPDELIKGTNMIESYRANTQPAAPPAEGTLEKEVMYLGRNCAVDISGDPADADDIRTTDDALAAIRESIQLGHDRCDELNALQMSAPSQPAQQWTLLLHRAMIMLKGLDLAVQWELAPEIKKEIHAIVEEFESANDCSSSISLKILKLWNKEAK